MNHTIRPVLRHTGRRAIATAVLLAAAGWLGSTTPAHAQSMGDYPNKSLRVIVPFPPGGASDTLGRMVAQHLQTA